MSDKTDGKKERPVRDTHLPVTIKHQEIAHVGFRQVVNYTYSEVQSGLTARREIIKGRHAIAVVAHDPELEKLVMIRQFRLGAQLGTDQGFTVELAAGLIDEGEDEATAAKRELLEETGLEARRLEPMCRFLTTPGMTDEVLHIFYAEVDASKLAGEAGHSSESEQTFPFLLTLDEAMEAVDTNAIYNGIVMLSLMWFSRNIDTYLEPA
ncbi:MAG: NUDIX domain-containing protein [Rhizobiaceae bacterium]